MKPEISIIMPVHNAEKFLRKSIESLLNQECRNFELLIIDDMSRDSSRKIISEYEDDRVLFFSNKKNEGVAKSLNRLIKHARGKYIVRMDADDISVTNRLDLQLEFMERNEEVGILGGQISMIDEAGEIVGNNSRFPLEHRAIAKELMYRCPIAHPTYFVRKKVYQELGGYSNRPAEDYDFLLRALSRNVKFANLPEIILFYRVHSESVSQRSELAQLFYAYQSYSKYKSLQFGKVYHEGDVENEDYKYIELVRKSRMSFYGKLVRVVVSPVYRLGRYQIERKIREFLN